MNTFGVNSIISMPRKFAAPHRILTGLAATFATAAARRVEDLRTPCLVCYHSVLERNAATMADRAASLGCRLRPHFKTVKTLEGASIATGGTQRGLVVSTLAEARFLADGGFDDLVYAVPLTPDKIDEVLELHDRLESLSVMVDHAAQAAALVDRCEQAQLTRPLRVLVGVDCGYHRDGCDPQDPSSIELVRVLCASGSLYFGGLYTHGGHSYDATSAQAIRQVGEHERDATVSLANKLRAEGIDVPCVGVGSTPTCR